MFLEKAMTGAIRSKGKFEQRFGKFEIKCKLPAQPGWWVAFWLMSSGVGHVDDSGEDGTEIDIMEGFGWIDRIRHALHWDGYGADHQSVGKKVDIQGLREGYHLYALEWDEAVNEQWANNPQNADYPDYFIVDYVKVYKKEDHS